MSVTKRTFRLSLLGLPALLTVAGIGVGCGAQQPYRVPQALIDQRRPIGSGPRFRQPARGAVPGPCRAALGPRRPVHVELFLGGLVALIPRGIGVRGPVELTGGRIVRARCFGALTTLEPTGVVLLRPGRRYSVGDLLRAWGARLPAGLRIYVGGRRRFRPVESVPLEAGGEVVLEAGPYVPPHSGYGFPPV